MKPQKTIKKGKADNLKDKKGGSKKPPFVSYKKSIRKYLKKEGYYYNKKEVEKEVQKLSKIAAKQPKIEKNLIFSKWKEQPNQVNKKSPQFWGGVKVQAEKKAKKVQAEKKAKKVQAEKKAKKKKQPKKKTLPKKKKQTSKYPKDIRTYYNSLIVNFIDELFKKKLITIEIQYDNQSYFIDTIEKKLSFDTQVFKLMQDFSKYCFENDLESEFILFPIQEVEEDIYILFWDSVETRPEAEFPIDSYFFDMTETE